jgi:hypothetical protein
MRSFIALSAIAAAALFVAPQAHAASPTWCSVDETESCIYSSLQQCLEGANSTNAICEPSNHPEDRAGAPRVRRQTMKR